MAQQPPVVEPAAELQPREAMRAFGVVEAWVRAGAVGAEWPPLPAVHGASVALRVNGVVVGRGVAFADEGDGAKPAIRAAAERAIGEARAAVPVASDAMLQERAAAEFWARATLSLELAGPLVPLSVATYDDADAEVRPGIEGIAVRVGSKLEAVFPGAMLARNIGPGDALSSAISRATGEPGIALREDPAGQPGKLAETRDLRCYRFRTVQLAQTSAGMPALFLDRGERVVRDWPRGAGDIRAWASMMARNIVARRRIEGGVVEYAGVYRPVTGRFDAPGASAFEEILAARALLAYARTPGVDPALADEAARAAVEIVDTVAARKAGERAAADDVPSAALWCCLLPQVGTVREAGFDARDSSTWPQVWRERYEAALEVLMRSAAGLAGVAPAERAVVAFALARRAVESWPGSGDAGPALDAARSALDAVYAGSEPGRLAAFMPWIGWGEVCLRGEAVGAAPALREFREVVYTHQLRADAMAPDNADLAGGIVFTGARSPLPTWSTARVAAYLASALGDARLTDPAERVKEMSRLADTLRFVRQLTADEACGWMYSEPERAAGGVRVALWDQRQPLEATALSLITACETLRSMGAGGR